MSTSAPTQALRTEIANLQRTLALTTLCVTHDREDARVLADRVVAMRAGRIDAVMAGGSAIG